MSAVEHDACYHLKAIGNAAGDVIAKVNHDGFALGMIYVHGVTGTVSAVTADGKRTRTDFSEIQQAITWLHSLIVPRH